MIQDYIDLGLDLVPALNAREAGIQLVYQLLSSGQLKVFKNACPNWLKEYRMYQRDEKGNIVKKDDHLMDATRYFILSGRDRMRTGAVKSVQEEQEWPYSRYTNAPGPGAWMGK